MNWLLVPVVLLAPAFFASRACSARADDEEYVKVEIKGTLKLLRGRTPAVTVKEKVFQLSLKEVVGGPPTEKQLKEWDGEVMVIDGRLAFDPVERNPFVLVTRITLYKKPDPNKN